MADVPVQVIVAAYTDVNGASSALESLRQAKKEKLIDIEDAAVITQDKDGKVKIRETADMTGGRGATVGAITGGVIGILAGPVGWAALGGAAVGGLAARIHDGGFKDQALRDLGDALSPNSSVLVAVIDHKWVAEVEKRLAQEGAKTVRSALRDDIAEQIKAGHNVSYTMLDTGQMVIATREVQSSGGTPESGGTGTSAS
jgi:uncharacterized membrane protein